MPVAYHVTLKGRSVLCNEVVAMCDCYNDDLLLVMDHLHTLI